MELVRISTAGSVDDGKSTLIGRLLYDNNALTKEQEALIEKKTREKGLDHLDLSVITDGLIAEREQGITIDVAHIYFSTQTRKFIIADSPGHVEYTRNMVTGASTAESSIILIDARKGLLEQSYRHFYISHLLRLENVIFCINKMDLVEFNEDTFLEIAIQIQNMVKSIDTEFNYTIVPISSLKGDNVVYRSENMNWYTGPTLNEILHQDKINKSTVQPFRFDVQQVYHVQNEEFVDYRGYAGRVISGEIEIGDKIMTLPSNRSSIVTEIRRYKDSLDKAFQGDSIILSLSDDIDISRGALITKLEDVPESVQQVAANIVWMDQKVAVQGMIYLLKSGSKETRVKLQQIDYLIDPVNPSEKVHSDEIKLNDIASVEIRLSEPAYFDRYQENKKNGAFILIDPQTNNTVAVGFIK